MKSSKTQAGFTFVEVVFSITILSIIAVGVGQALLSGQKASREVAEHATVVESCEDMLRQMAAMSISGLAAQDGTTFAVGGVEGTGTVAVTNPYLESDDIANVVLSWDGVAVLERAFGNAAMVAAGGESGGGGGEEPPEEPQWYSENHVVTSPNYPSNYSNNYDHTWTISEPGAQKMRVHFSAFRTRHSYDRVYIKDGFSQTAASYYGNRGSFTSAEVNGDTIKIRFNTNSWGSRSGWRIDKYEYYK
jgi:prepilin-type N-terminal cleavage/methylation domain-containing protein